MKKFILCIVLLLSFSLVFETVASAKLKDSPRVGYKTYIRDDAKVFAYNKPNGKKLEKIKYWFHIKGSGNFDLMSSHHLNRVEILKFTNKDWVKVKYATKTKNGKLAGYKIGYIKVKYLTPNDVSSYNGAIVIADFLNLRSRPNVNSKVIKKIPLGTFLELGNNSTQYVNHEKRNGWLHVEYIKSGKKYQGYVAYKYVQ